MSLEQEIHDAGRAQVILGDEIFKRAVSQIEEALLAGIRNSAFKDEDLREKLCQRYALLHDLLGQLRSTMETGQLAKAELDNTSRMKKIADAAKSVFG